MRCWISLAATRRISPAAERESDACARKSRDFVALMQFSPGTFLRVEGLNGVVRWTCCRCVWPCSCDTTRPPPSPPPLLPKGRYRGHCRRGLVFRGKPINILVSVYLYGLKPYPDTETRGDDMVGRDSLKALQERIRGVMENRRAGGGIGIWAVPARTRSMRVRSARAVPRRRGRLQSSSR